MIESDDDVDQAVAECLAYLAGCGRWQQVLEHMEECGWPEADVDAAYRRFGERVGRAL